MTPVRPREPVIPMGAWITAVFVALAMFLGMTFLFREVRDAPLPLLLLVTVVAPLAMAG